MAERILVAEDQENLCRLIQTTLEEQGYEVAVALGGDAAIHELQPREFDLGRYPRGSMKSVRTTEPVLVAKRVSRISVSLR